MEQELLIESLPVEIIANVFYFLDSPAPSEHRLHDQPNADMLRNQNNHQHLNILKNVSLVNRRWYDTVLPFLFKNIVWYLTREDLMRVEQDPTSISAIPPLLFIQHHNLASYVKSMTLVVVESDPNKNNNTTTTGRAGDVGLYRRGDGSGHYGYIPNPLSPATTTTISSSSPPYISSFNRRGGERDLVFNEDTNWLWKLIFDAISPLRFTIIASPPMLASLLARMLFLGDAWSFDQSHHILSLSREDLKNTNNKIKANTIAEGIEEDEILSSSSSLSSSPSESTISSSRSSSSNSLARPLKRVPSELFTVHPWTHLLLNEGSSTRVYKTYEYYHKRPPSMLGALLGAEEFPNDTPLVPSTVRDLSYVGIFPLSTHFDTLVQHLPPLHRLFVQLVPRNDILSDRKEMEHLDMNDLWAERNMAYGSIMPKLFDRSPAAGNWRSLQVFESGDAADRERWELTVDYVHAMGFAEWRAEREGVFVKRRR